MSAPIAQIGRCIGCDRPARLDDGVCEACLTRRGRRWAEMSRRCRTDPEYALAVYAQIKTDRGREMFLSVYGPSVLHGRGSTIAEVRKKLSGGTWQWEVEWTVPPPPCGASRSEGTEGESR